MFNQMFALITGELLISNERKSSEIDAPEAS